jgi:UDP-hydrolysing UDP-N-acetyl-D-glucosamine 2-epimerase
MNIAVFTTSRADVGPLTSVYKALEKRLGGSVYWFERLNDIEGDWIAVILGDRFETLELVFRLNLRHVAVAHLSGGDITEGSQDDCFRHAITKLSHLHFPTNDDAARRIVQMGEEPWRVHMLGSPSLDEIFQTPLLDRAEALRYVGLDDGPFVLVSLHPNTFGKTEFELAALRDYLRDAPDGVAKIFIGPNSDDGHGLIDAEFRLFARTEQKSVYRQHIPRRFYLSLMKHCVEMIGNSSAMLYEAPSLGARTVLIGDRQKGREPIWGDGKAAERIAEVICGVSDPKALLRKKFNEIGRDVARKVA